MDTTSSRPHLKRAATVHDVASAAGVSRQTVSNVVNAPERVADATRARVQTAISQLGYRPYGPARNLRARRSSILGYSLAAAMAEPNLLLDRFLAALTAAASERGYGLLLFTAADTQEAVAAHADLVANGSVDGFVISGTDRGDRRVDYLTKTGVPFVTFGRTGSRHPHDWVDVDGAAGTRLAVEHLAGRGHRRIAFVGWPPGSSSGDERVRGWRQGLRDAGLKLDAALLVRGDGSHDSGVAALHRLLSLEDPPTAIVAVSDTIAVSMVGAALRLGVDVGRSLAVVGFDDTALAVAMDPPLTTVRQPLGRVAQNIVARLEARLAGAPVQPGNLLMPELIVRKTA